MEFILIAIIYTATPMTDGSAHTQVMSQQFGSQNACEKVMNDIQVWTKSALQKARRIGEYDVFINCYPKN